MFDSTVSEMLAPKIEDPLFGVSVSIPETKAELSHLPSISSH